MEKFDVQLVKEIQSFFVIKEKDRLMKLLEEEEVEKCYSFDFE